MFIPPLPSSFAVFGSNSHYLVYTLNRPRHSFWPQLFSPLPHLEGHTSFDMDVSAQYELRMQSIKCQSSYEWQ